MKSMFLLLGSGLLMTTLAVAQDLPSNSREGTEPTPNSQTSKTYKTSSNVIRGCLSGSSGNYTVTDQNGMQYNIAGPDNQLAARVGHEIEITTRQDQSSESASQGDQANAKSTNTVQVSDVRDVASTCKTGGSTGSPMNDNGPKGSASTAEPPQMMAMLQEQSAPNAGTQEQKPGAATQPQTTPPVSSQTPATSASPTGSNTQAGASSGAAGSQMNPNNANATGSTAGSGSQGASSSSNAASNSATPSGTQHPQVNSADDANKPLYERQATDIPWASQSSNGTGSANSPH